MKIVEKIKKFEITLVLVASVIIMFTVTSMIIGMGKIFDRLSALEAQVATLAHSTNIVPEVSHYQSDYDYYEDDYYSDYENYYDSYDYGPEESTHQKMQKHLLKETPVGVWL